MASMRNTAGAQIQRLRRRAATAVQGQQAPQHHGPLGVPAGQAVAGLLDQVDARSQVRGAGLGQGLLERVVQVAGQEIHDGQPQAQAGIQAPVQEGEQHQEEALVAQEGETPIMARSRAGLRKLCSQRIIDRPQTRSAGAMGYLPSYQKARRQLCRRSLTSSSSGRSGRSETAQLAWACSGLRMPGMVALTRRVGQHELQGRFRQARGRCPPGPRAPCPPRARRASGGRP